MMAAHGQGPLDRLRHRFTLSPIFQALLGASPFDVSGL